MLLGKVSSSDQDCPHVRPAEGVINLICLPIVFTIDLYSDKMSNHNSKVQRVRLLILLDTNTPLFTVEKYTLSGYFVK